MIKTTDISDNANRSGLVMALSLLVKVTLFTTSELENRLNKKGLARIKPRINLSLLILIAILAGLEWNLVSSNHAQSTSKTGGPNIGQQLQKKQQIIEGVLNID